MSERETFGERLFDVSRRRGRLCVGIDPHPELLKNWGLSVDLMGLRTFSEICVAAFGPTAALVKPQVAMYEAFGSGGYAVLEQTIQDLRAQGALVLADAKRGDIGSTMTAYARAWLADESPLCSDAVTVSPYLGFGSLQPALELAKATGRGIFVLAATSNPEGRQVQSSITTSGERLDELMVAEASACNAPYKAAGVLGYVGVVIGATLKQVPDVTGLYGPVLMPGVGAQGADAADVARIAKEANAWAFPNMSREILRVGPDAEKLAAAVTEVAKDYPEESA